MIFTEDEDREEVVDDILAEVDKCEIEIAGKADKWDRWRRNREGITELASKDYPFANASNVCVPLTVNNVNTVYAQLKNMFGVINPFWTANALQEGNPEDIAIAKTLTRYFDILCESPNDLDKKSKDKVILYESGSMGTCWVKVPWVSRQWKIALESEDGIPQELPVVAHNGPALEPIPLEDFLVREAYQDVQTAPQIAHVVHKTWHELKLLEEQGIYENVDEIEEYYRDLPDEATKKQEEREDVSSIEARIYDILEVYKFVDLEGSYQDCIFTIERNSGVVLREGFNELGIRPFVPFIYLHRPYRKEGIGVCQLCDHMQGEVDMLHNTRIDSVHIGVAPMLALRKNSGYKTGEKIYPGKMWFLDDPSRDITPLKLPEPYPQSLQAEQMSMTYAQKASGMSDAMGGFADAMIKSRDSPGLMSMRVKQGSGVFGAISEGIEDSYSQVAVVLYYQLIRHRDIVMEMEKRAQRLSQEELMYLDKALSISPEEVPLRIRFSVRTSDVEQTFEAKRQNLLTMTQLYAMFFQQTFPVAQQLFSPVGLQMQQTAPELYSYLLKIYTGRCRMMEETMKFFGEGDTAKYVPDFQKFEKMMEMQKLMQALIAQMAQGGMNGNSQIAQSPNQPPAFGGGAPEAAGGAGVGVPPQGAPASMQAPAGASPEPGVGGVF